MSIGASRPSEPASIAATALILSSIVVASAYAYYASQGEEKKDMKMMFCAEEEKEPVVKKILDKDSGGELTESLLDAVIALNPSLTRLDDAAFAAGCRVVVRADHATAVKGKGKVSLISGGGSGHEPAHAGFVGEGALTAAVCGDVFASPSAKAVLAAIVATASPAGGCLLIVKNYTGDRLNFGIAAATATSRYGIPVETVYVADDVALSNAESPRGLAGTLAVHKVAGAAAAAGAPLADVAAAARATASAVKTMGVAYEVCTLPGRPASGRLGPGEIELGLGIHGEPGAEKSPTLAASDVADKLAEACVNALPAGDDVALIINDLGATTPMELAVFGAAAKQAVERRGKTVKRILSGGLMTALDMHGVSLSVLAVDAKTLERLDAPCWTPAMRTGDWQPTAPPAPLVAPDASVIDDVAPAAVENDLVDARLANALRAATKAIVDGEESLTAMDEKVGDGDCGITLAQGAKAAVSLLDRAGGAPRGACAFLAALSKAVEDSMGGSSGALYNLGLKAAEKSMRDAVKAHAGDWSDADADAAWKRAFVAFAGAISECGGAKVGSRTMCDALLPAADVFEKAGTLDAAAAAAQNGAASTAKLVATHGRSAYVSADVQDGVADPGAHAVGLMFAAVAGAAL